MFIFNAGTVCRSITLLYVYTIFLLLPDVVEVDVDAHRGVAVSVTG